MLLCNYLQFQNNTIKHFITWHFTVSANLRVFVPVIFEVTYVERNVQPTPSVVFCGLLGGVGEIN